MSLIPTDAATIIMTTDSTLARSGQILTGTGSLAALGAWIVSSTGLAVISILGVILGIVIQWYFKAKEDKRKQEVHLWSREEHIARMAMIRGGDLKATASEIVQDLKKSPLEHPEVPPETTVAKVIDLLKQ